jgi:hypothetical protein
MDEYLKTDNIARAIRLLPAPKTYPAMMVTVSVGKLKYNFEKNENKWLLIIKEK